MTPRPAIAEETIAADESAIVGDFLAFMKEASARRYPAGTVGRFNQARAAGCVEAEFTVLDALSDAHRVGLFAVPRTYTAWIRFGNAVSSSDREKDIRGMSIKLSGVTGENLTPGVTEQDFVLNSHPVMMAANTRDFLELLEANEAGGAKRVLYFATHLKAAAIATAAQQNPSCHLDIPYWSATPYLFGAGQAVKYIVRPTSARRSTTPAQLTDTYLSDALRAHLGGGEATFDFLVQFQTDPQRMPIEDATVEWNEHDSPYHCVARIRIPAQVLDDGDRAARCERTGFNPWHCLADHRPLGSMNRARRKIYRAMAHYRAMPRMT